MPEQAGARFEREREKLRYFVLLRQMEAESPLVREAYQRLADVAAAAEGWDPRTLILDWLESELRGLGPTGTSQESGGHLMGAAVALANALKQ